MPFIDQHEVVPLEGVDGDRLLPHLLLELGDFDDLDRPAREERPGLLREQVGVDPRGVELFEVLLGEALVGRQQDDPVQPLLFVVQLQVVLVLEDVDVHQQRLAAAGGIPEGQLSQVIRLVVRNLFLCRFSLIELGDVLVQVGQQLVGVTEEAVEVDFGEEQREVLEILPLQRLGSLLTERQRVLDDVLVVAEQRVAGELLVLPEQLHLVQELVDVVLVQPFQFQRLQMFGQLVEAAHLEQRQHPLVQDEFLVEPQRRCFVFLGSFFPHDRLSLHVLNVEHEASELFFDEADLPCLVATAQVFEVVVAVDVDQVVLLILRVVVLLLEPLVEGVVVGLVEVSPENQRAVAVRVRAFDDSHAPDHVDVLDGQAQEPVEGLDKIDVDQLGLAVALDSELVLVGVAEGLDVQERLAAPAFHVEHVREDVLLTQVVILFEQRCLLSGSLQFEVDECVLVGFEADVLHETA